MSTDLAVSPRHAELLKESEWMVKSGLFPDVRTQTQAIVKAMAGRELGLGPFAAQSAFDIIEGRIQMSANLIASRIKAHPRYDYRVIELDRTHCTIRFFEDGEPIGEFTFDDEDRAAAGLALTTSKGYPTPWKQHPKAMFFARAVSQGARVFCPDVFFGIAAYTPGEIAGEQEVPVLSGDDDPSYAEQADSVGEPAVSGAGRAPSEPEPDQHTDGEPESDGSPDPVVAQVVRETGRDLERRDLPATPAQKRKLAILAEELGWSDDERHYFAGVDSFNDLRRSVASDLIDTWSEWVRTGIPEELSKAPGPLVEGEAPSDPTGAQGHSEGPEALGAGVGPLPGFHTEGAGDEGDEPQEEASPADPREGEPHTDEQFERALRLAHGKRALVKRELSVVLGKAVGEDELRAATRGQMQQVIENLMAGGRSGR